MFVYSQTPVSLHMLMFTRTYSKLNHCQKQTKPPLNRSMGNRFPVILYTTIYMLSVQNLISFYH